MAKTGYLKGKDLDDAIMARTERLTSEQAILRRDLAEASVQVGTVGELVMRENRSYLHASPILVRHLHGDYSEGTLESIARALAMKESYPYWDELVELYVSQPSCEPAGPGDFSMGLAAAISASIRPERMGDLIDLLKNRRLRNRALLLTPLRRRSPRDPKIAAVLEELRHDPDLSREINSWKGMKKAPN